MLSPDVADEATHEKTLFCAAFTIAISSRSHLRMFSLTIFSMGMSCVVLVIRGAGCFDTVELHAFAIDFPSLAPNSFSA